VAVAMGVGVATTKVAARSLAHAAVLAAAETAMMRGFDSRAGDTPPNQGVTHRRPVATTRGAHASG